MKGYVRIELASYVCVSSLLALHYCVFYSLG